MTSTQKIPDINKTKKLIKNNNKNIKKIKLNKELHDLEVLNSIELENFGDESNFLLQEIQKDEQQKELASKKTTKKSAKSDSISSFFKLKPLNKWINSSVSYSTTPYNLTNGKLGRETLNFPVTITPLKNFFMGATFKYDLNNYSNIYYQPDFSYAFGYSDWHDDTWGLNYSNYANNKLNPKEGEKRFNFDSGTWDLNYKTKVKDVKVKGSLQYIKNNKSKTFNLTGSKVFYDKVITSLKWKHHFDYAQEQFTLSAKSYIYKKFMVSGSAYIYSNYDKQSTLEPDYAYSFGWYDTRPLHPTITYSNYYMPTRWPGKEQDDVPFSSGVVSVKMNFKF